MEILWREKSQIICSRELSAISCECDIFVDMEGRAPTMNTTETVYVFCRNILILDPWMIGNKI